MFFQIIIVSLCLIYNIFKVIIIFIFTHAHAWSMISISRNLLKLGLVHMRNANQWAEHAQLCATIGAPRRCKFLSIKSYSQAVLYFWEFLLVGDVFSIRIHMFDSCIQYFCLCVIWRKFIVSLFQDKSFHQAPSSRPEHYIRCTFVVR